MKLVTRVNLQLKNLIGEENWAWIKQAITQWEEKAPK